LLRLLDSPVPAAVPSQAVDAVTNVYCIACVDEHEPPLHCGWFCGSTSSVEEAQEGYYICPSCGDQIAADAADMRAESFRSQFSVIVNAEWQRSR
jgi:hypothetical protein